MPCTDLQLSATFVKRLCGVTRKTFNKIVEKVQPHLERQGRRGGQNKLTAEDQLLVTLEYWREYRSQFHIAASWGLHETTVGRIIKKVKNVLTESGTFSPNKSAIIVPAWRGTDGNDRRCRGNRN